MAALPTPDPRPDSRDGESDQRLRLLRELGEQVVPAWAALDSRAADGPHLVVVERVEREAFDDGEIADWIRDARRLSALEHPNVARVRDVVIRRSDVLVVSEFVDGVRWTDFAASAPLETALRVLVDALTGLSAIHNLRDPGDPTRQLFKLVHSGLTPDCIVVGLDGVSRVVGASRPRSATARLAGSGSAYLAPEVLLEDESADARADIYSVGVLLWEALSGKRFLPGMQPSAIVTQLLGGRVPAVTVPEARPWAAPLADVVMRALSADPEKRFSSAAAMSAEVRRIGALKLPLAIRLAAGVREAFGDTAKARRDELERGEMRPSAISLRASSPPVEELSVDVTEAVPEASQNASTVPPPMAPDAGTGQAAPAPIAIQPLDLPPPALVAPPAPPADAPPVAVSSAAAPPAPALTAVPSPLGDTNANGTITAAPFALATSAMLAPPQAPAGRPKGILRIVAGGFALLVIGGATFWLSSRGPATHPAAAPEVPTAVAQPAADSARESVIEAPAPTASAPAPVPTPVSAAALLTPTASAAPGTLASARVPAPPAPVVRSTLPAGPAPARPKRSPGHREYDPQGI